jgi:hypothetical protein
MKRPLLFIIAKIFSRLFVNNHVCFQKFNHNLLHPSPAPSPNMVRLATPPKIEFTDFPLEEITLYYVNKTILLPGEY